MVAEQAATMAAQAGLGVVVTSLLESSHGIKLAAHFASARGLSDPAPGLATAELLTQDLGCPSPISNGHLSLT